VTAAFPLRSGIIRRSDKPCFPIFLSKDRRHSMRVNTPKNNDSTLIDPAAC
jgi:hypothetical protein